MRVFVTGGTGAVGRFVVPALVVEGHEVTVLARGAEKAAQVERQGGRPALVDLFDPDGLATAVAGPDDGQCVDALWTQRGGTDDVGRTG
jgi:uncharacterized protein YbjT (DUF2867 family)